MEATLDANLDLALVGVVLAGVQNHSLGVLAAAARGCGASVRIVPFTGWLDMERTLHAILALRPRMCGVSLQTSEAALATMALTKLLRERGFSGRIVCGGHLATLQAEALLRCNPALDAVVRFAGEAALCGLLRAPWTDDELARLPGIVFRAADGSLRVGAAARIRAPGPLDSVLTREGDAPQHLGFGAADLTVSQGCEASCAYCCVAGATRLAGQEQRRAKLRLAPYARQPVAAIADCIAALYHERRVRVLNFMDDNVLPLDPVEATAWAEQMQRALRARNVARIAFSMQIRADAITPASADALVALGLVRGYIGIDCYSAPQLRALGRRADADAGPNALELLWQRGVFSVANALLIGPTLAFESVVAEIEGLARVRRAPVHLLPIEARPGTRYFEQAERLGLLEGGFLLQHYRFADRRTELLGRVVTSMPTRLAERSVPIGLYDLGYNLGIARRLLPEVGLEGCVEEYARISAAWNLDQIRLLREAAAIAATEDAERIEALIARERERVSAHDRALLDACDAALAEVEAAVAALRRQPLRAHARGKLLGALALSMSLAGCSHARVGQSGGGSGGSAAIAGADAQPGMKDAGLRDAGLNHGSADASQRTDGGLRDAALRDAAAISDSGGVASDAGNEPDLDAGRARDATADACPAQDMLPSARQLSGCPVPCATPLRIQFDAQGKPSGFSSADGGALSDAVRGCLQNFIGDYCYPSLAGMTQEFSSHCWIA